MFAFVVF